MSQEVDKQKAADVSRQYFLHMKYNSTNSIIDGASYTLGMGMASATVLTYFVSTFVRSNALIGLLTTLQTLLLFLPQYFAAPHIEKKDIYMPALKKIGLLQRSVWLFMGLATLFFAKNTPILFLVLFYSLYGLFGFFSSYASVLWLSFITKIIPPAFQARFFGMRYTLNGVAEIVGSIIASFIFKIIPYPVNYGVVFIIAFIFLMISYCFLTRAFEFPTIVKRVKQKGLLSRAKEILLGDKSFLMYFISTVFIVLGKAGFSFQIIYAKVRIGINSEQAAFTATIIFISQTVGYAFWSYINTKFGYKKSIEVSSLIFLPAIIATLLMKDVFMLYIAVGLFGFAQSARNSGENNLVIALCPNEADKPAYIGLRNTLLGPFFAFVPLLGGVVADLLNYEIMFIGSAVFTVAGYLVMKFFVHVKE